MARLLGKKLPAMPVCYKLYVLVYAVAPPRATDTGRVDWLQHPGMGDDVARRSPLWGSAYSIPFEQAPS